MVSPREAGGKYQRIAERTKGGKYELVEPFDYLILALLQEEGTLMGGYYPVGTRVVELRKRHFKELNVGQISGRLKSMEKQGLTKIVHTGNLSNNAWQRTKAGKEVYEAWQQSQQSQKQ